MKLNLATRPTALLLALAGVFFCDSAASQQASDAMPITITRVSTSDVAPRVPAAGTVFSRHETQITSGIAGRLEWVVPLLAQRKWYTRLPYGYARGWEPVLYVNNIRAYYDILQWLTANEESDMRELEIPDNLQPPAEVEQPAEPKPEEKA